MSELTSSLKEIEDAGWKSARFYRVALHVHSPQSYDWGRGQYDKQLNDRARLRSEEGIEEFYGHLARNFDLVAITDHMKCRYAVRLGKLAKKKGKCRVLPGMEVNLRPPPPMSMQRLHLIVIFPEDAEVEQIWKVIPNELGSEQQCNPKAEITDIGVADFVAQVKKNGGLCTLAHVDSHLGVRHAFRQTARDVIDGYNTSEPITAGVKKKVSEEFKRWLLHSGADGIEVGTPKDRTHYSWESALDGKKVTVPVLLANDAHCIEALSDQNKVTCIKMTSPSFLALKQALAFPETRIRFKVDLPPSPRLVGIQIKSAPNKGFFKNANIALAENLSCLIGPRGSGKSALIEALRYTLGYNRTLGELGELGKKVRSLQAHALSGSVIRVFYQTSDGQRYVLESTFDEKEDYTTKVLSLNGHQLPVPDVERSGRYPMRLFGWSEIELLGRDAVRQRELLDRLIPGLPELAEKRKTKRNELVTNRLAIEKVLGGLKNIVERNDGEIARYAEYKKRFDDLNTDMARELFRNLDQLAARLDLLGTVEAEVDGWRDAIASAEKRDLVSLARQKLEVANNKELTEWWTEVSERLALLTTQANIIKEVKAAGEIADSLSTSVKKEGESLEADLLENQTQLRDKVSKDAATQVAADLRARASARLRRAEALRDEYKDRWAELQRLLRERSRLCEELEASQEQITGKRATEKTRIEQQLNTFQTKKMQIDFEFGPGKDRGRMTVFLMEGQFFSGRVHGQFKAHRWPQILASNLTPIQLARHILAGDIAPLTKISYEDEDGARFELEADAAKKLVETLRPLSRDTQADLNVVDAEKLDKLLNLQEVPWDDAVRIRLNARPIDNLSPGQRSSAMLPLIALSGTAPLVIDQPEDNLDNRLVGEVLAGILAELKEKRQIIVATHNPNIVVSGDAEQVIVLNAVSDTEGKCEWQGSIDTRETVKAVIETMEGGKEAFERRRRRYGL